MAAAVATDVKAVVGTSAGAFRPSGQQDLGPSGDVARVRANVAALRALREIEDGSRAAGLDQQATLARWSGWGAVPAVFDARAADFERFAWARAELRELLSATEYAAAERSTINAHYTDASYVTAIWEAAEELGFRGGNVLEPGCGSGNFLAFAPAGAAVVGVELEPVTASIAARLHPQAQIRAESFADTRIAEGSFDLVVGNVPFGDVTLHDRRHNAGGHRIHNHFLLKSLHLTRPGGLVLALTSRYTLDAANPAARREMAELADLVGAVRLPSGSHRRAAGTEVVTDVLVLRRREPGSPTLGESFERSLPFLPAREGEALRLNEYFAGRAEHVLGELRVGHGEGGRAELSVVGDRNAGDGLRAALATIVAHAREKGLVMTERPSATPAVPVARVHSASRRPDGYLEQSPDGGFTRIEDGAPAPWRVPASQERELANLLALRDAAVGLLQAEASSIDDSDVSDGLRAALNQRYDRYVGAYGPLNRFSERRTGRTDPGGEAVIARIRPPQGGFRGDPFANVVYALEHFDPSTQSATKATIFHERVVSHRAPQLGADNAADALAICLDATGEVRLEEVARLLGVDQVEARTQLGVLVFDEPGSGRLVPGAEYLSGNVRAKLAEADAAAREDGRFGVNVAALTEVRPRDLRPDEIHARLGAVWIGAEHVRQFLRETLEDPSVQVEHPGASIWAVRSERAGSVLATSRWGTDRMSAVSIAESLLEQRPVRIYDQGADGERVFNATATVAAAEKANELSERFSEWVWESPERGLTLALTYNERFNAIVPRSYDGARLTLPGLALSFEPRPHQVAAVARMIHEPAVGLFHEVGAGKTAEMVMGAMELRRLGLAAKPVVVVPNHMLEQFSREWLQLYPQARLLAASSDDLERERRRLFVAKCATGDWDAVIMTRGAFERIPMSQDVQRAYLVREVEAIESMLVEAKASDARFSVKRLQRMKLQAEERIKRKLDGAKDPGISFEQIGVDYIIVDEAHAYKNLRTTSNIPGMAVDGSQRATDLHMKLEYLREKGARVATLATATPIANSMGEAYTMQRYLRPDLLEAAGVASFDQWAATFGETTTAIEVSPDGSGMRLQTRFAKFRNVPELLLQWRVSADIKTAEDLKLPVPALAVRRSDGQRAPETVVVAASEELRGYVAELARRADAVRARGVDPSADNLLKISSDGRAAGLELRLVGRPTSQAQKVDVAAGRIAEIFEEHRLTNFPGSDGLPHPTQGALQLVFCDLGTPNPGEWSVYEQLRKDLTARGVPRAAIRFVHEARNDREKGELFAACRDGRVAVLIGSTERMGVGTNVQLRAVALHHLDCPWRPADLAQRDGRILRQGNANPEVRILRYVTEGSFDGYLWQTVTRKAQFIGQVMRGRLDVREIEDIGEAALSYNEVKALATGNPLLLEQAQAQAEVSRLERLERSHARTRDTLKWTVDAHGERIVRLEARALAAQAAMARVGPASAVDQVRVQARTYEKRGEANEALRGALSEYVAWPRGRGTVELGALQGFAIEGSRRTATEVTIGLRGVPESEMVLLHADIERSSLLVRLENRLVQLPQVRDEALRTVERLRAEIERARNEMAVPFRQAARLELERARLNSIHERLSHAVERAAGEQAASSARPPDGGGQAPGAVASGQLPDASDAKADKTIEERWTGLFTQELSKVQRRASNVATRLDEQLRTHSHQLARHREAMPAKPGALSILTGGRAGYDASLEAWSTRLGALERRQDELQRRLDRARQYALEPVAGFGTAGTALATHRVLRREPRLASDLEGARKRSRERTSADLEGERGRRPQRGRGIER